MDGVKGLLKLQGKERGPYPVISRDSHNNVWVDINGTPTKFSVEQIQSAPTLNPVTRPPWPPTYPGGSLKYSPPKQTPPQPPAKKREDKELEEEKIEHQSEEMPAADAGGTQTDPDILPTPDPAQIGGRETRKTKPPRQYVIIRDTALGQNYACELQVESPDLPAQAHLYARAKGGSYHPIWYDQKIWRITPQPRREPRNAQKDGYHG